MNKDLKSRSLITNGFSLPYNPELSERAKEMRKNMTSAETKLWNEYLCSFKYRIRRQKQVDNYIVDFYCAKLKLVIEIDGKGHENEETIGYDEERTKILESYGLRVIRFKNEEVLGRFEDVCKRIQDETVRNI